MTICASCGTENVDGARYCARCGQTLQSASSATPAPGAWRTPTGDIPNAGSSNPYNNPGAYTPPVPSSFAYGGAGQGAGVGANLNYAQWIDRVLAALIDGALAAGVMIVLWIFLAVIGGGLAAVGGGAGDNALGNLFGALGSSVCCIGFVLAPLSVFLIGLYNKIYLVSTRGFSIGQGIMKLKVVDAAGNLLPMGTAALRFLVQLGLGIIPFIGAAMSILNLLWPLWDEQRQTLHDKAVSSFVIKTE